MDSTVLAKLLEYIKEQNNDLHAILVIRNGYIVLEAYYSPYNQDKKHILNSCTKSFVSALVGIAIDKGYIVVSVIVIVGVVVWRKGRNKPHNNMPDGL